MDSIHRNIDRAIIKKQTSNHFESCSVSKSALNSYSVENMTSNSTDDTSMVNVDGFDTEVVTAADVVLINLEIGERKLENVQVDSQCLLQDLAEEFAQNETIRVVYFLNETIKKGGAKCDAIDAQVLVRLKPQWKFMPLVDLVEDQTQTLQELLTAMPDYNQIVFSLAPKPHRCPIPELQACDSKEEIFVNLVTELKSLFDKYPINDLVGEDGSSLNMLNSYANPENVEELKQLLHRGNDLVKNYLVTEEEQQDNVPTHQHKQTQSPEDEDEMGPPVNQCITPIDHATTSQEYTVQLPTQVNQYISSPSTSHMICTQENKAIVCLTNVELHEDFQNSNSDTIIHVQTDEFMHDNARSSSKVRIQFDKSYELPLLRQWFNENPAPSKQTIKQYVDKLNANEMRQGKDPVTYRAVYIWFKNSRARNPKKKHQTINDI